MLAVAAVEAGILASRAGFAPGRKGGGSLRNRDIMFSSRRTDRTGSFTILGYLL